MKMKWKGLQSLKGKIIFAFIVTSIIPVTLITIFSYVNTSSIVKDNVEELVQANLQQTKTSLDLWVDSYEDILFQIYMDDDIVDMVEKINKNEDIIVTRGQLRKKLQGMFYTKEYIKAITIITETGQTIFYDMLTGSFTKSSWLTEETSQKYDLYKQISIDNNTHFIPTEKVGGFTTETCYLFHIGHRIIDYQNVNRQLGVVIVSIDENMLEDICNNKSENNNYKFMVDHTGNIISHRNKDLIGTKIISWTDDIKERKNQYREYIKELNAENNIYTTVNVVYDKEFKSDIVSVSTQEEVERRLKSQQSIRIFLMVASMFILGFMIMALTKNLMGFINDFVKIMQSVGKGEFFVRVETKYKAPTEFKTIETQFNKMVEQLEITKEKERVANIKQRNAEIAALEAQINPHFLYNTLDTINWIAIDHDDYEVSNAIGSLASILRYTIDKSNAIVTVQQEMEWLKQYLFLQQTRLKNKFECEVEIDQEVQNWRLHKQIIQPYVENSIIHGFEEKNDKCILRVMVKKKENQLVIIVWDNGKGMEPGLVNDMNKGVFPKSTSKNCIGVENSITRTKMYYGDRAQVKVESQLGQYTKIQITIPRISEDDLMEGEE